MRKLALISALGLSACAGGTLQVVDTADIPAASGPPTVLQIRDLGTALLPRTGPVDAITDGSIGPGELLDIEGDRFGRQPTVLIGGRPAALLARTGSGGAIVRVPRGVPAGKVDVAVTNASGSGRMSTTIRRLAVVLHERQLRFAAMTPEGPVPLAGSIAAPGARAVRIDTSGAAALVLSDRGAQSQIGVVDLTRLAPVNLGSLALPHRATHLAIASESPRAIALGGGKLSVIDITSTRRPVLFDPAPLPADVRDVRAAELSPDGKVLAVLLRDNRLVAIDVTNPTAPQLVSTVGVLPHEKQPLVQDVAFSPDGLTLWVVSGASADTYPQVVPTRITAVKMLVAYAEGGVSRGDEASRPAPPLGPIRRDLSVWKTQIVTGAGAPISLVVGNPPDAQGSAIRTAPEVASVFVTTVKPAVLALKGAANDAGRVQQLLADPGIGSVARAELSSSGGTAVTTPLLLGALALSPGGNAVAIALRGSSGLELGIAAVALDGQAAPRFAPFGAMAASELTPPFSLGRLALQP